MKPLSIAILSMSVFMLTNCQTTYTTPSDYTLVRLPIVEQRTHLMKIVIASLIGRGWKIYTYDYDGVQASHIGILIEAKIQPDGLLKVRHLNPRLREKYSSKLERWLLALEIYLPRVALLPEKRLNDYLKAHGVDPDKVDRLRPEVAPAYLGRIQRE